MGLTVLCPFLAFVGYAFQRKHPEITPTPNPTGLASRIEILIPAHNEAPQIATTLTCLQRAIHHLESQERLQPVPQVSVRVGADGCTDDTVAVARRFSQVAILESQTNRGKWSTLKTLVETSPTDWVVLVDAGTVWPAEWLTDLVHRIQSTPRAVAIAPGYRVKQLGWISRVIWKIEKVLKKMESFSGGPVSLHGTTVSYPTPLLKNVFAHLGETRWLNDDIVIPLMLRALYPAGIIVYPVGVIEDGGIRHDQPEWGRRKRMMVGNLQWAFKLLPGCFRKNPVAGVLAIRRLFRVVWAYWLVFVLLALGLIYPAAIGPLALGGVLLVIGSRSFRQIVSAGFVSLSAPFRLMIPRPNILEEAWK